MDLFDRIPSPVLPAARIIVGSVFLIASIDKVRAPGAFADAVRSFHLLPSDLVIPFAFVVPWIELLVAAYLLFGFQARLAATVSTVLLGMFVFALGIALATGDTNHACGCFGQGTSTNQLLAWLEGGQTITPWDVIRDVILIGFSLLIVVRGAGPLSIDERMSKRGSQPRHAST